MSKAEVALSSHTLLIVKVSAKIVNGCKKHSALPLMRDEATFPEQDVIDCVVEDSKSTKQETTKWQPGSAQAQFGVKGSYKNLLFKKFLWVPLNHHSWWGCHY
ncbi:MAG: hypothetical protein HWQ41_25025 [Nostoc sp. NOS(2021)]|uniref:hypothetical protein n=1 Tax=Nostoc sp. NOS(2021) TaxID=2815407 RepID=UPI0025F557F3|nr:hypothetical protein [Nostoc sp. NOS(2021)]MBN3898417.1 hypothetical protein [Nostoc sp. NOS(2021)]